MNPVSVDIKNVLVNNSIGIFQSSTGWSINIGSEPTSPHTTITIYDTGGSLDYTLDRSDNPTQHSSFQIRVRSKNYLAAYAKALEIGQLLDKTATFSTGDVTYYLIQRTSDTFFLGRDDNSRNIFTITR